MNNFDFNNENNYENDDVQGILVRKIQNMINDGTAVENIIFRVESKNKYEQYRTQKPCRETLELLVVYDIFVKYDNRIASYPISHRIAMQLGLSEQQLFEHAKANTPRLLPFYSVPAETMMRSLFPGTIESDDSVAFWIYSNETNQYGATALLYPEVFSDLGSKFNDNIIIIPSSQHEVLAMPEKFAMPPKQILGFVVDINRNVLTADQYLADAVYRYNHMTNTIELVTSLERQYLQSQTEDTGAELGLLLASLFGGMNA